MQADHRKGDWMQTYSGRVYWPLDPRADEVNILDIAHALGNLCRYTGHTALFYSVAEHSIHVSRLVPPEYAMIGLLHDATEAYVNDIASPLKRHLLNYKEIEEQNWLAIAEHFGLPAEMPPEVKIADNAILLAEQRALMPRPPLPWGGFISEEARRLDTRDITIYGLSPAMAKAAFIQRYSELLSERQARK